MSAETHDERDDEVLARFGEVLVAARNVAPQTLQRIVSGAWRPKSPGPEEREVLALVDRLGASPELASAVRYFVDLAFHKLLTSLELGEGGLDFELTARRDAREVPLIDGARDRELRGAWFDWLERHGE